MLFAAANLARKLDVDAEAALRAANAKFERRFRAMEAWRASAARCSRSLDSGCPRKSLASRQAWRVSIEPTAQRVAPRRRCSSNTTPICRSLRSAKPSCRRWRREQVLIVAGDTGSGKSTQLPQYCLELGRGTAGLIAHTQPRRLAARALAARIAEELGQAVGGSVGFRVRFADRVSEATRLVLMTDGLLLAELASDPLLRRYDTIIVDEAHERTLNVDLLLGVLKRLLPRARISSSS